MTFVAVFFSKVYKKVLSAAKKLTKCFKSPPPSVSVLNIQFTIVWKLTEKSQKQRFLELVQWNTKIWCLGGGGWIFLMGENKFFFGTTTLLRPNNKYQFYQNTCGYPKKNTTHFEPIFSFYFFNCEKFFFVPNNKNVFSIWKWNLKTGRWIVDNINFKTFFSHDQILWKI